MTSFKADGASVLVCSAETSADKASAAAATGICKTVH